MPFNAATWMSDFAAKHHSSKINPRFKDFTLIGSHDAGLNAGDASGKHGGGLDLSQSITQTSNVAGQLQGGARWFDIRLKMKSNEAYTVHETLTVGAWGESFSSILDSCISFLDSNPSEFICLKVTHTSQDIVTSIYNTMKAKDFDEGDSRYYYSGLNNNNIMEETYDNLKGKILLVTDKNIPQNFKLTPVKIAKLAIGSRAPEGALSQWTYMILQGKYSESKKGDEIVKKQLQRMTTAHLDATINGVNHATCLQLYWTATGGNVSSHSEKLFSSTDTREYLKKLKVILKLRRPHIINIDFVDADKAEILFDAIEMR